jgi:hypothetical protein
VKSHAWNLAAVAYVHLHGITNSVTHTFVNLLPDSFCLVGEAFFGCLKAKLCDTKAELATYFHVL